MYKKHLKGSACLHGLSKNLLSWTVPVGFVLWHTLKPLVLQYISWTALLERRKVAEEGMVTVALAPARGYAEMQILEIWDGWEGVESRDMET